MLFDTFKMLKHIPKPGQVDYFIFTEAYLKTCQSSNIELFAKIVNNLQLFFFAKSSLLDV